MFAVGLDEEVVIGHFIFPVGVDVSVKDCQTVNISDGGRNLPQRLYLFLIRNPFLKYSSAFPFQSPKQEQHKLLQVLYL